MSENYPARLEELRALIGKLGHELPGPMAGFLKLNHEALAKGALEPRFKELIALGIGVAQRCESCIIYHVHGALKAGASRAEIIETLGVAMMMGGGPATMYACDALAVLDQFEAQSRTA